MNGLMFVFKKTTCLLNLHNVVVFTNSMEENLFQVVEILRILESAHVA